MGEFHYRTEPGSLFYALRFGSDLLCNTIPPLGNACSLGFRVRSKLRNMHCAVFQIQTHKQFQAPAKSSSLDFEYHNGVDINKSMTHGSVHTQPRFSELQGTVVSAYTDCSSTGGKEASRVLRCRYRSKCRCVYWSSQPTSSIPWNTGSSFQASGIALRSKCGPHRKKHRKVKQHSTDWNTVSFHAALRRAQQCPNARETQTGTSHQATVRGHHQ